MLALMACLLSFAQTQFTVDELFHLRHHKKRARFMPLALPDLKTQHLDPADSGAGLGAARGEPHLKELVGRINAALSPFFRDADKKKSAAQRRCFKGWSIMPNAFLPGCPSIGGCKTFKGIEAAKKACEELGSHCGGLIEKRNGQFEMRAGNSPVTSTAGEQAHVKIPCTKPITAENVYDAFHHAIDAARQDPSLHLDAHDHMHDGLVYSKQNPDAAKRNFGAKQQDTIFLSVASYRDENCGATVASAFEQAAAPELLAVGVVEQNCHGDCLIGTGWGATRRIVKAPPDVDCLTAYCASRVGRPICDSGRVKLLRLNESESYGPLFARYIASKLWSGQEYFAQVDSHTAFKKDWDSKMIKQMQLTPSFPSSVISNYPPGSEQQRWASASETPMALCNIVFSSRIMRLGETKRTYVQTPGEPPRHALYIAAGFLFTHASFLREVPFDPYLPYIFMGEEIIMTTRAWTAGFDMYGPTEDICKHMYVRQEASKFWWVLLLCIFF
jgi:hypothetical protein